MPPWLAPRPVSEALDTAGRLELLEETTRYPWPPLVAAVADALAAEARAYAERFDGHRGARVDPAERFVDGALRFVQSLPFRRDPPGGDTYQGTLWTLAYGGDCEDLSALLVQMIAAGEARHGFPLATRFTWLERPASTMDHVVAEVSIGGGPWQWLEPSVPGARRGVHPFVAAEERRAAVKTPPSLEGVVL